MQAKHTFLVLSAAGANRDLSKGSREQRYWDEHAEFIDTLVDDGFILLGGPLVDEGGAVIVVNAADEQEIRDKLKNDPWYQHEILNLVSVKRWDIYVDQRV